MNALIFIIVLLFGNADISPAGVAVVWGFLVVGYRHLIGKGHVDLAAREGAERSRAFSDYGPLDAVEIGSTWFPIISIANQPDKLVRSVRDKLNGPVPIGCWRISRGVIWQG
jgi:hypothetical protein